MIKLIALDLDGTLMSPDHLTVSSANREALRLAHENGIKIAISTGRTLAIMGDICEQVPEVDYIMYSNGACVFDRKENRNIYTNLMSSELSNEILSYLEDKHCFYEIYAAGRSYAQEDKGDYFIYDVLPKKFLDDVLSKMVIVKNAKEELKNEGIEKITIYSRFEDVFNEVSEHFGAMTDKIYTTSSIKGNCDMTKKGVDKGTALDGMCKVLGITADEVMAFGDAGNDCPMLEYAGYSYAMANGSDECKASAKFETKSNADDGVAFAILNILEKSNS